VAPGKGGDLTSAVHLATDVELLWQTRWGVARSGVDLSGMTCGNSGRGDRAAFGLRPLRPGRSAEQAEGSPSMRGSNLVVVAVCHDVPQMCHRATAQGRFLADHEGGSKPLTCANTAWRHQARPLMR
jgi:hypothetical protein